MAFPVRRATPQRPPTRGRSRLVPAAQYNSGGIRPTITVAVQKRRPTRGTPDANSGVGVTAALSPQLLVAPSFNSGGIVPTITSGIRRKNLNRPVDRLQVAPPYNSGGVTPSVTTGVRRRNLYRAPERLSAQPYNSGSLTPIVTRPVRYLARTPRVRPSSIEPPYSSGGRIQVVVRGVLRRLREALHPRLVVPPTTNVVVAGTPPTVSQGRRWIRPAPQRARIVVPPPLGPPPTVATVIAGRRWAAVRRAASRIVAALRFNSGGIVPVVNRGATRKPGPTKPSRIAPAPPYTSGGRAPNLTQGLRRPAAKGRPSRRQVPPTAPLPPGTQPVVTRPLKWAAVRRRVPRVIAPGQALLQAGPGGVEVFLVSASPTRTQITDAAPVQARLFDAFPALAFVTDIYGDAVSNFVGKALRIANWGGSTSTPVGGFRNSSGTLYDPPSPQFRYRLAGGGVQTISGGSLTHDGTGLYSAVITPTVDGDLVVTAVSGDGAYADPVTAKIEPAPL